MSGIQCIDHMYTEMVGFYRLVDANDSCMYAEIRTRIPDTTPNDYVIEDDAGTPISFAVKVSFHAAQVGDNFFSN